MFKKLSAVFLMLSFAFMFVQPALAANIDIEDLLITVLKEALKEGQKTRQETTPAPSETETDTARMNFIKVAVTEKNVNLRDQPSAKGRVLAHVIRFEKDRDAGHVLSINGKEIELYDVGFLAESEPIKDSSDNSTWYRLFFYKDNFHYDLNRLDKDGRFNSTAPYVDARYLEYMELDDDDKAEIEYFKQGRPLRYRTGDRVKNIRIGPNADAVFFTKKPVSMYLEPRNDAKVQELPAGSKVIVYNGPGKGGPSYNSDLGTDYFHMDMDDVIWHPVIADDKKIIGWTKIGGIPEGWLK